MRQAQQETRNGSRTTIVGDPTMMNRCDGRLLATTRFTLEEFA